MCWKAETIIQGPKEKGDARLVPRETETEVRHPCRGEGGALAKKSEKREGGEMETRDPRVKALVGEERSPLLAKGAKLRGRAVPKKMIEETASEGNPKEREILGK